jgi:hypothetical protein
MTTTETTETTETHNHDHGPDPRTILCRVVDVNGAIQNSFMKFLETEGKTLEDLASLIRDELGQMELFAPQTAETESTAG